MNDTTAIPLSKIAPASDTQPTPAICSKVLKNTGRAVTDTGAATAVFNSGRYRWLTLLAADNTLSSTAARVGIIIFQRVNMAKGYAWPSIAHLAKATGAHRSSVIRGLRQLRQRGWITRDMSGKPGTANRYRLAFGNDGDLKSKTGKNTKACRSELVGSCRRIARNKTPNG